MNIKLNLNGTKVLYEQIEEQLQKMILTGELKEGMMLPSVRLMSQELGVSIITTRRAYTDLEQQGFVETIPAKGTFVSKRYEARLKHLGMVKLQEMVQITVLLAKALNVTEEETQQITHECFQNEIDYSGEKQIAQAVQMIHYNRQR